MKRIALLLMIFALCASFFSSCAMFRKIFKKDKYGEVQQVKAPPHKTKQFARYHE